MWQLAKLCAALMTIVCVGEIAALATSRPAYRDPFAPFADMMAGQPVSVAEPACNLHPVQPKPEYVVQYLSPGLSYCVQYPGQSLFASVSAYALQDRFVQTSLRIASRGGTQTLYIGDVVLRWGQPDTIMKDERSFYVTWHDQGLYALIYPLGTTARFSYWLPVASLTIGTLAESATIP